MAIKARLDVSEHHNGQRFCVRVHITNIVKYFYQNNMAGKHFFLAFLFCLYANVCLIAQDRITKIACIGNSVTAGYLLKDPAQESYSSQLQILLGNKYEVKNFGHSGATLLKQGHNPYYKTKEFDDAVTYKPDIAVIHLGLNDTDPRDWPNYKDDFEADYNWLLDSLKKANPAVKLFICRLSPIFSGHPRFKSGTREWYGQIQERISEIAEVNHTGLIDLHEKLYHRPDLFPDALHPVKEGAAMLAQTVYENITQDFGGLNLPAVFTDNMVLQRNRPIVIYGTANGGERDYSKF
jgi:sialate O-acetylesterase